MHMTLKCIYRKAGTKSYLTCMNLAHTSAHPLTQMKSSYVIFAAYNCFVLLEVLYHACLPLNYSCSLGNKKVHTVCLKKDLHRL